MKEFEILCVTMKQNDFSKIKQMNIRSNVVFANQSDRTEFEEISFLGHTAKMITTATRGVGVNRNLSMIYASGDICLFSDDDVVYKDDMENIVLTEFNMHPEADVIIFHFDSDTKERTIRKYKKTKQVSRFARKPWATFQIAFRRAAVLKNNIHFTTLFGGGCKYPCGEDTQWIRAAFRHRLKIFVSDKTIGNVSFAISTWFKGYNAEYYYGQGAAYESQSRRTKYIWMLYMVSRTYKKTNLRFIEACKWMCNGNKGFSNLLTYKEFCEQNDVIRK